MLRRIQEEQDDDETSSSRNAEEVLEEFRVRWVQEVTNKPQNKSDRFALDPEVEARELFLKAVDLEQSGKMVEAIRHYRRALQLVPDIESKVFVESNRVVESITEDMSDEEIEDFDNVQQLVVKFHQLGVSQRFCEPMFETPAAHISHLPSEVIDYILRWVVSVELDVRSLCHIAMVSRGFCAFAEEAELWRRICFRTWGTNCGLPSRHGYATWKDMFIHRPHVLFHGCYITKTTYIRPGENSFQDSDYQPWHIVEYFRLFRFYADGTVLMHTTGDDLAGGVGTLRNKCTKNPNVLRGFFKMFGTRIVATIRRVTKVPIQVPTVKGRKTKKDLFTTNEQINEIEFELKPGKNKANRQLTWVRYQLRMVYGNGHESVTDFDLNPVKFPPMLFSRVKSYSQDSEAPV